ncbi:hypothetical protein LTR56_016114 [Elasticomyces elasticus]|nr:hypothetical protein LTR56_016114 [Elasticomyces elasticus]KAK3636241.1 hypothetical protein LTR22_018846 [Elasticomyces elasticus]KAK4918331.1 hypothetical protein LTR49_013881 [Elasticomyces elasticus]KAK5762719.1 hypothetical protein LTS12_007108 [Elasticomyces elasticus]
MGNLKLNKPLPPRYEPLCLTNLPPEIRIDILQRLFPKRRVYVSHRGSLVGLVLTHAVLSVSHQIRKEALPILFDQLNVTMDDSMLAYLNPSKGLSPRLAGTSISFNRGGPLLGGPLVQLASDNDLLQSYTNETNPTRGFDISLLVNTPNLKKLLVFVEIKNNEDNLPPEYADAVKEDICRSLILYPTIDRLELRVRGKWGGDWSERLLIKRDGQWTMQSSIDEIRVLPFRL